MSRTIERLTFITDAPHFGGAEQYIVAMAQAARRRGIKPHVHWMRLPIGEPDVFRPDRVGDLHVTASAPGRTASFIGLAREFRAMLRLRRPDALVINACGRPRFWILPWLARRAHVPAVWVHQMVDGRDHRRLRPRWIGGRVEGPQLWRVPQTLRHRLAAAAAVAVVTLNPEDGDRISRWQRVRRDKIHVVPHGVDFLRFQCRAAERRELRDAWGIPEQAVPPPFVVGTAGRLVTGKRVDLLIDAIALLRRQGVPAVAVVAGQGPHGEELRELARRRGVADAVRFVDFVEHMPGFYSALDVFVLCSETESFGLALAEAMATERPVVATPTAGAHRQIEHGRNGWLLRGFSPEELAAALAGLYADPAARHRMGTEARAGVVRHFSIDLTLERTLRALSQSRQDRSNEPSLGIDASPLHSPATEVGP